MTGISDPRACADKAARDFHPLFLKHRRAYIRTLLDDDLITEYAENPLGLMPKGHSLKLQAVIAYFRMQGDIAFYMPIEQPDGTFGVAASAPGKEPEILAAETYPDADAARTAIFRRRVQELRNIEV